MKILLTAINAKYIHSNLAVYSLQASAGEYKDCVEIAEFTINNQADYILEEIYKRKPDVLMFSCYIWNLSMIEDVMREFHKLCPKIPIWVGGPEVSFEIEDFLYLAREKYELISNYVEKHNIENKQGIHMMKRNLSIALESVGIENEVYHVNKEMYKIYKYIIDGGNIEEIDDLDVIHIVVEDNLDCYLALGVVHSIYTPLIGKLKDYISSSKYSMYQALHTVVIPS